MVSETSVEREVATHIDMTIKTILNNQKYDDDWRREGDEMKFVRTVLPMNTKKVIHKKESSSRTADIKSINETFLTILSAPRSSFYDINLKEMARNAIAHRLVDYSFETFTQSFKSRNNGQGFNGMNVIGIRGGVNRGKSGDEIVLIGAHFDTVNTSPGVDDNGSGITAILEIARLLSFEKKQFNHTIMLVAFDLEELGLLGSDAFVREYLIPVELQKNGAKFLGAYILDMVLNYDYGVNTQTLPNDFSLVIPGIETKMRENKNRGNFLAVWCRKNIDCKLYDLLASVWVNSSRSSKYRLFEFTAPLPATNPSPFELYRSRTFTRSDHASFWYHNTKRFPETLKAVLLTDMGPWRGVNMKCYHQWCDDRKQLSRKNLDFIKHTIDALYVVATKYPPKYVSHRLPCKTLTTRPSKTKSSIRRVR